MADRKSLVVFSRPVGLFSLYLQVLGQVAVCRKTDAVPIVYFNSRSLYWSDRGHHGVRNVWEYYFEPVSERAIGDVVDAEPEVLENAEIWDFSRHRDQLNIPRRVGQATGTIPVREGAIVTNEFPPKVIDFTWEMPARRKRALNRIIQESLRVRPRVAEKAAAFQKQQFGSDVLGVHIRGAERAPGRLFYAPDGQVPLERYIREIDTYLASHPASGIFCATDSQGALDVLEERYGSRVVSYPAARLSPADEHLGLHHTEPEGRSKAEIGEEVVIECLLLSRCNYLLHGSSNVSLVATLMNPMLGHLDVYRKYGYALPKLRIPYLRYWAVSRLLESPWGVRVRDAKRRLLPASNDVTA